MSNLPAKISRLFDSETDPRMASLLESLLRQRAVILNKAQNKLSMLADILRGEKNLHHALFYCVSGQINEVLLLLGKRLGLRVHRFTAQESTEERTRLLEDFSKGRLQALVAMRCLDEGVVFPTPKPPISWPAPAIRGSSFNDVEEYCVWPLTRSML